MRSAYRKLEGGAARLALVVHGLRWASGELEQDRLLQLDLDSMMAGITLSDWFLAEAGRVYDDILRDNNTAEFDDLTHWIRGRGGKITAAKLSQLRSGKFPTSKDAKKMLDRLTKAGHGSFVKLSPPKGGRPTETFYVT